MAQPAGISMFILPPLLAGSSFVIEAMGELEGFGNNLKDRENKSFTGFCDTEKRSNTKHLTQHCAWWQLTIAIIAYCLGQISPFLPPSVSFCCLLFVTWNLPCGFWTIQLFWF